MYTPTGFIPNDLEINTWDDIKPFFDRLFENTPENGRELEQLIVQYSETLSVFHEQYAWSYINMSRETDNQDHVDRFQLFSSQINPEVETAGNKVEKKKKNIFRRFSTKV